MIRRTLLVPSITVILCILVYASLRTSYLFQDKVYAKIPYFLETLRSEDKEDFNRYFLEDQQKVRRDTLKNTCSKLKLETTIPQDDMKFIEFINSTRLFFSDKYKLLACLIPKVGCTNFKKVLLVAEGLVDETDPNEMGSGAHVIANRHLLLQNLGDVTGIKRRLNTYYKVIMVREPLHRMLSAYRNKFENFGTKHFQIMAKKLHAKYSNSSKSNKESSNRLSFEEFATHVSSSEDNNMHWDFFYQLCSPCAIKYDFIAKLETVDDDIQYIMNKVGMKNLTFPQNYPPKKRTDDAKLTNYFEHVSPHLKDVLIEKYKYDSELFGYSSPFS